MFCGKCGEKLLDGATFCEKCGSRAGERVKGIQPIKFARTIKRKKILLMVAVAATVFAVCIITAVAVRGRHGAASAASDSVDSLSVRQVAQHTVETQEELQEDRQTMTTLNDFGDVYLQGEYPVLETIVVEGGLSIEPGVVYPNVKSIQCTYIMTEGYSDSVFSFDPFAFPALQSVTLATDNSCVDQTVLKTLETLYMMQDGDMLQEVNIDISHTIEDLYGTWKDKEGKIALTFRKDGSLNVSGGSGIIGVELLTYSEVDDDTLYLSINGDSLLTSFNAEMDYFLLGDVMFADLAGEQFEFYRD